MTTNDPDVEFVHDPDLYVKLIHKATISFLSAYGLDIWPGHGSGVDVHRDHLTILSLDGNAKEYSRLKKAHKTEKQAFEKWKAVGKVGPALSKPK